MAVKHDLICQYYPYYYYISLLLLQGMLCFFLKTKNKTNKQTKNCFRFYLAVELYFTEH